MYSQHLITYYLLNRNNGWLKVALWFVVFIALLWSNQLYRMGIFHPTNLIFNAFAITQVIAFHYLFKYHLYPRFRKERWVTAFATLIPFYVLSSSIISLPFHIAKELYPNHHVVTLLFQNYAIKTFSDLFRETTLIWFLTTSFWCNMLSVIGIVGLDLFRMQQDRFATLRARDEMEIKFLRAQVQPHFLFNTLNNIYGLLIDYDKQSNAILNLSEMMRYSLYESRSSKVPLLDEISFVKRFLKLEKARLVQSNLCVNYDLNIDHAHQLQVSPLILSQFLEELLSEWTNGRENCWINISIVVDILTVRLMVEYQSQDMDTCSIHPTEYWLRMADLEYKNRYLIKSKKDGDKYHIELTLKLAHSSNDS